jgi:hypothetical protein
VRERSDKLVRELVPDDAAPFVPLVMKKRGKEIDYEAKIKPERLLIALAPSRTAGISIAIIPISGLARLYETARRQWADRQTSATILQFPNGNRLTCA